MRRKRSDDKNTKETPRVVAGAAVLQQSVTDSLTRAFFCEWAETGYAALSLERVAGRAGVGKAALYRRWPSKMAMAADRLAAIGVPMTEIEDTGSLPGDIRALLLSLRRVLRHPVVRRIVPDLHAEAARSSALADAIRPFQIARRRHVGMVIDRAIARNELDPSVDRDLVADLLGAPIYWRMVIVRGVADQRYIETLAGAICATIGGNSGFSEKPHS